MNKQFWSELIKSQTPYVTGEQPKHANLIKLNTNENPYPPSPAALDAIRAAVNDDLRLYPPVADDDPQRFVGNGSDEVLAMAFMAFFAGKKLYAPDITYSFYPVWAKMFGADYVTIPLNDDFSVPVERFCSLDGCVILANPNAPTGIALLEDEIERIISTNPGNVVLIDEAYIDFSDVTSAISLIGKYPNLLVVKTLSKSLALAGLRVARAAGHPDLIAALRAVRDCFNSYTLDRLALAGMNAAIADQEYYFETIFAVTMTRELISEVLMSMGFVLTESAANFLFVSHPGVRAEVIYTRLRERGILVRWWNLPRIDNWLRITVGTDEQMLALVAALKEIVS